MNVAISGMWIDGGSNFQAARCFRLSWATAVVYNKLCCFRVFDRATVDWKLCFIPCQCNGLWTHKNVDSEYCRLHFTTVL